MKGADTDKADDSAHDSVKIHIVSFLRHPISFIFYSSILKSLHMKIVHVHVAAVMDQHTECPFQPFRVMDKFYPAGSADALPIPFLVFYVMI